MLFCSCENSNQKDYSAKKYNAISKIPTENSDSLSIQELMLTNGLKGLSVAVFEDYKIVWADTWGHKYDSVPLDINTAFSTASIAKPITAMLFAILEEKGLIDLKVPVNNYLKRWKVPKNAFTKDTPVTLEHLLSHTAGTTQHGFADFYEGDTIPTILESVKGKLPNYNKEIEITFTPGSNWSYSGGGYTIAMMALEDHLGRSLSDLAQEHIFNPLKLQNTTMLQPNEGGFLTNIAKAHDDNGNVIGTGIPITPQVSASGLWSTPSDLSKILIEIQKALNGQDSKVISKKVAKRITDIVISKAMLRWSLGWERGYAFGNQDWFSHNGANTGVGGDVYATMQSGKGIVFFGNGPNGIRIPVLDKLRDNIIRTHGWKIPLDGIMEKELPKSLIKELIGRYKDVIAGPIISIEEEDNKLFAPFLFGGKRNDLIFVGDSTFLIDEVPGAFKLVLDRESSKVTITYSRDSMERPIVMFKKIND